MSRDNLPVFDGKDFPVWKMVVGQFLAAKNLGKYLETIAFAGDDILKDREALSYITRNLDLKHARLVLSCKTAAEAWAKLCQVHATSSAAGKIGLQRQFFATAIDKDKKVADYISRVEYIRSQLADAGHTISESSAVAKIVTGLPPAYRAFCTQWASTTEKQQTLSNLLGRLLEEESMLAAYEHRNEDEESGDDDEEGEVSAFAADG